MPLRLGILVSGGGTTLQNLTEAIARRHINAQIVCCIASNENCYAIERARNLAIPVEIIARKTSPSLDAFSDAIARALRRHNVELVLMAGFLALWKIPGDFRGRVMNIHPALLPKFGGKGMHGEKVHAAVLAAGESQSGCTVHWATDDYDSGPIILQKKVPVFPTDTPDTLAQRVFIEECNAYPEAVQLYIEGRARLE